MSAIPQTHVPPPPAERPCSARTAMDGRRMRRPYRLQATYAVVSSFLSAGLLSRARQRPWQAVSKISAGILAGLVVTAAAGQAQTTLRPRARDVGIVIGVFQPGPLNAITDVSGMKVGQTTVDAGDTIHRRHRYPAARRKHLCRERVPAALFVMNGFGKLLGVTQLQENAELETPILLTCTLCVWRAADAMVGWLLRQPDMQEVRSINPVVGETDDGGLSDIGLRPITEADVVAALEHAASGPVAEGSVGAGRGTQALGWKGGIGTELAATPRAVQLLHRRRAGPDQLRGDPIDQWRASRSRARSLRLPEHAADIVSRADRGRRPWVLYGHCRDRLPLLSSRDLERLAKRAALGIGRTGSFAGPGSGEYVLSFSTAESVRRRYQPHPSAIPVYTYSELGHDDLAPLFEATVEATEEAIIGSLFRATPVRTAATRKTRCRSSAPWRCSRNIMRSTGIKRSAKAAPEHRLANGGRLPPTRHNSRWS